MVNPSTVRRATRRKTLLFAAVVLVSMLFAVWPVVQEEWPEADTPDLPSADLFERVNAWRGVAATTELFADDVPFRGIHNIPDRMFTTWKTKTLNSKQARSYWWRFHEEEPRLEMLIINDTECAALASLRSPSFRRSYDRLPVNVMRADICRVLAVHFFGGYYKDLDVDWRRPLKEWIVPSEGFAYGVEDEEHVCQWFFAARPGHPCLEHVLQHIGNLIADPSQLDFSNSEIVIDTTGPGAWTDALQRCPVRPKYSISDMKFDNVYHDYASQRWVKRSGYASWISDRQEKSNASGKRKEDHSSHFLTSQSKHLKVADHEVAPIEIVALDSSPVVYNLPEIYGAHLAFDGTMDTAFETTVTDNAWLEFQVSRPQSIHTEFVADRRESDYIAGVRFFNRHRVPGYDQHGKHHLELTLYDDRGRRIHALRKERRLTSVFTFNFAGYPANFSRLRIQKIGRGALTFSEIQFFVDPPCHVARKTVLKAPERAVHRGPLKALSPLTVLRSRCANGTAQALSASSDFQFSHCGPLPMRGTVLVLSKSTVALDPGFVSSLTNARSAVIVISPGIRLPTGSVGARLNVTHHATDWCGGQCATAAHFERFAIDLRRIHLAFIDDVASMGGSLVSAVADVDVPLMFVRLLIDTRTIESGIIDDVAATLTRKFAIYAFHVNPRRGIVDFESWRYPAELQLSLSGLSAS